MPRASVPLRRELLGALTLLVLGAVLVTGVTLAAVLPLLTSPIEVTGLLLLLLVGDLIVAGLFGRQILRRSLIGPVDRLVDDIRLMTDGDLHHRIGPLGPSEFEAIRERVNAMADRLTHDQELLAENVASLDHTNRELIDARDQVVQAARLASVGTLAAGIAHEVGNPLGAIVAFADVAHARIRREGGDTEIVDAIRAEAERIDRLLRGLLDFARPSEREPQEVAVVAIIERVRELLHRQGRLEQVEVAWPDPDPALPDVLMDPAQLEQVLVNLLLNALDVLEGHPSPRIEIEIDRGTGDVHALPSRREDDPPGINYMHRRRVSRDRDRSSVTSVFTAREVVSIRIRDNGPGVPAADRERVFDPFFTTKEPGKGTGLGLYISARFVEGMGGRLEILDPDGGGAEFVIHLPGVSRSTGGDA